MDTAEKFSRTDHEPFRGGAPRVVGRVPQRQLLSESPQALQQARELLARTVGELEEELLHVRARGGVGGSLPEALLRLLRRVVSRETAAASLEEGLASFFAKLGGSAELESDVRALYAMAHAHLQNNRHTTTAEGSRMLQTMAELIAWYARRAETLLLLRHELRPHDEEGVFDVQVFPNTKQFGVEGLLVTCRATVAARRRGDAWIKLFVRRDGKLISPAAGWQYWVDDTDAFLAHGDSTRQRPEGVLCVSAPVVFPAAVTPRAVEIFDRIRLFVPHGALGLSAGVQTLDIEVELTGSQGPIRTESVSIECAVPPQHGARLFYPSPQALGMWADDVGSGSSIRELQIDRASVGQGWRGAGEGLRVRSALKLVGFNGSAVTIEYRLLRHDGRAVPLRATGRAPHQSDEVVSRLSLHPDGGVSNFDAVEVRIPLGSLELPAGRHQVVLEKTVLDSRGRIVCGVAAPVEIAISDSDEAGADLPQHFVQVIGGSQGQVGIAGIELQPRSRFAQREQLRVSVGLVADSWKDALYMVEVAVQAADAKESDGKLAQRLWVVGDDESNQRVVANFDYAEILSRLPVDTQREYRFIVTVRVRDHVERIVAEQRECCVWSAAVASITIPEPPRSHAPIVIVDLQSERLADGNQAVCSVALNVSPRFRDGDQAVLYYEVLDANDRPLTLAGERHGLPGSIVRVDLARLRSFAAQIPGSLQVVTHLQFPLAGEGPDMQFGRTLRIMLLNAQGVLLQAIHHSIVSADSEVARRQELLQIAHDSAEGTPAAVASPKPSLWSRFIRYLQS